MGGLRCRLCMSEGEVGTVAPVAGFAARSGALVVVEVRYMIQRQALGEKWDGRLLGANLA